MSLGVLNWLLGGSTVALIVLALVAPQVLNVVSALLVELIPTVGKAIRGLMDFVSKLWEGFKDVVDNVNTILFVGVVAVASFLYGLYSPSQTSKCPPQTKAVATTGCKCPSSVKKDEPIFKIPGWELFR